MDTSLTAGVRAPESGYRGHGANSAAARNFNLTSGLVRAALRVRRMRDDFFDASLFADPAWDMLLDMAAAHIEKADVSVCSLCIAACVPPTTALRWIKVMTDSGLFERRADESDGRRAFIVLSDETFAAIRGYFAAAQNISTR